MDTKHRNRMIQEKVDMMNDYLCRIGSEYRTKDGFTFTAAEKVTRKFCTMFHAKQEILGGTVK